MFSLTGADAGVQRWVKVAGLLAGLALLAGLIIGFWPITIDSREQLDVQCGSAFAPDATPSGQDRNPWPDILGYTPTNPFFETASFRAELCEIHLDDRRAGGLFLVLAGVAVLGGVTWVLRCGRKQAAFEQVEPAEERAEQEARWRERGWVPAGEAEGPPPGWVWVDQG
jgi:hypothetical protein